MDPAGPCTRAYSAILANPVVAAVLFAGSLWVFYYSPLFRWATTEHIGHSGWSCTSSAPATCSCRPSSASTRCRIVRPTRCGSCSCSDHGVPRLLRPRAHDRNGAAARRLVRRDGATGALMHSLDQQRGGGIAWSVGEMPTIILAISVAISWSRSDDEALEAARPQGRPGRRRRPRRLQRDAREDGGARRAHAAALSESATSA
jgi:hypothetical protein